MSADPSSHPPLRSSLPALSISNDALSVALAFLDHTSLNAALAVCKRWSAVILSMRSVGFCLKDVSRQSPSFLPLLGSPLARRHVVMLRLERESMCAEDIAQLAASMPHLRDLGFIVPDKRCGLDWVFPSSLRCLSLVGYPVESVDGHAALVCSAMIRAIAQLPLLESLTFDRCMADRAGDVPELAYDLAPLAALPRLSSLSLWFASTLSLADALRQFPALQQLSLFEGSDDQTGAFFEALSTLPHALRLQRLALSTGWTDRIAAAMTRVPTITRIEGRFDSVSSLAFLASFPQLSSLAIDSVDQVRQPPSLIVDGLVALPQLTQLSVCEPTLSCADLGRILRALPELASLEMDRPSMLESLRCFSEAAPTLSHSLTSLTLYELEHPALTTAEFAHLKALGRLTHLCLEYAREGLIDEATKQALTPPSAWFPKLTRFRS